MSNPTAAMLVIGDEILSGRTRDANMHHLAGELTKYGIDLKEARVVPDEVDVIVAAVNDLRARYTHVFTSGGIGPTHDDITADCIAQAFDVGIDVRADAKAILAEAYPNGEADLTDARLRMARIPDGASLIDNSVSKAPGFTLENAHVMAGVPRIFTAMLGWLLPQLDAGAPMISETIRADLVESQIAGPLGEVANAYPMLSLGSYPFYEEGRHGANLVIRGRDADALRAAVAEVKSRLGL
ncbi:MAG: molybdopterin-binding protein [Pseudomonadota bacterium]